MPWPCWCVGCDGVHEYRLWQILIITTLKAIYKASCGCHRFYNDKVFDLIPTQSYDPSEHEFALNSFKNPCCRDPTLVSASGQSSDTMRLSRRDAESRVNIGVRTQYGEQSSVSVLQGSQRGLCLETQECKSSSSSSVIMQHHATSCNIINRHYASSHHSSNHQPFINDCH